MCLLLVVVVVVVIELCSIWMILSFVSDFFLFLTLFTCLLICADAVKELKDRRKETMILLYSDFRGGGLTIPWCGNVFLNQ